jgi:hypothetical protein
MAAHRTKEDDMTPDELLSAYPQVRNAVGYVEMVWRDFDGIFPGEDNPWKMLRREKPDAEPGYVADLIRKTVESAEPGDGPNDGPFFANARREMDHPQFMTYLAAIMGAL